MSKEKFKNSIDTRLSGLKADPYLGAKAKEIALSGGKKSKKTFLYRYKRVMFPVLSFAICVTLCISVAANMTSYFDAFSSRIGGEAASQLNPITKTVTENGLQMEVLGVVADEESTDIYISLNDLGSGIVDKNTRVYFGTPELSIFRPHTQLTFYDEENSMATYRVAFHNEKNMKGKTIDLTMNEVLVGKERLQINDIGIAFKDLVPEASHSYIQTAASSTIIHGANDKINQIVLDSFNSGTLKTVTSKPKVPAKNIPDWLSVENVGIVDGLLHIKYYIDGDLGLHNILNFEIYVDGQPYGRLLSASAGISKPETCLDTEISRLQEAILEIPSGIDPERLSVALSGIVYDESIKGSWTVSFEVSNNDNEKISRQDIDFGEYKVNEVKISPISATVSGLCKSDIQSHDFDFDIDVVMKDGKGAVTNASSFSVDSSVENSEYDTFNTKIIFSYPVDPDNIDFVILNGHIIYF